ncbi:MAG: hypothetical protein KKF65_01340, partial [Nanoarchaeota archaeon]|nr:hypothetical protein [Nanoarchaeota archaeon]
MVETFFRKIEEPNQARRKVLESSKSIIQNLKSYQKILQIREQKTEKIRELKIELKEINLFLDKLKDSFPTELITKFEEEESKKKEKVVVSDKKSKKTTKKSKKVSQKERVVEPSELTKLENKLSDIENRS